MNHIKLIEAIKEKHPELREEIEELKFGCEVEYFLDGDFQEVSIVKREKYLDVADNSYEIPFDEVKLGELYPLEDGDTYKIIGNLDLHILSKVLGYYYIIWEGAIYSIESEMYEPHDINEIVKLPNGDPSTWSKELIDTIIELI